MAEFRAAYEEFKSAGIGVYAISVDSVFSHQAFADQLGGIPYEMLSDFERRAVADYGVRRDDVEGYRGSAQRSVFVLDREGVIRWRWLRTPEMSLPDPQQVLSVAREIAQAG